MQPGESEKLTQNVYFVGFMGAGKSTIARRLARVLGVASLDMDTYIERQNGKSISAIFDEGGEELFRQIEAQTLETLSTGEEPILVSCGGGVIVTPQNRKLLKNGGYVIHLLIDVDEASKRISDKSSRPLFNDLEAARSRFQDRLPLYEEVADATIITSGKNIFEIADEIVGNLREAGVLCRQQK